MGDIELANGTPYNANIKTAFVDVNSISFTGEQGYWPIRTNQATVADTISAKGMFTNLNGSLLPELKQVLSQSPEGVDVSLSIYPSNNVKANFTGFNDQQRQIFADMSMIPALTTVSPSDIISTNRVDGVSMDFEGGLNSVGDTKFYKLLGDKLAFQGKWLAYFYFPTVISPAFSESLGPLGALQVSTYDVGTYRAPSSFTTKDGLEQQIIPGTVKLEDQGWQEKDITLLYQAYFDDQYRCDETDGKPLTAFVQKTRSWCNNSTNMSYSESHRMWTSQVYATGLPYGTPLENLTLFNGKIHLVLPVSWSATQFENLFLFYPKLDQLDKKSAPAQGLFMQNAVAGCPKDADTCLFNNAYLSDGKTAIQKMQVGTSGLSTYYQLSSLPGTIKQNGSWTTTPKRLYQKDYLNTNFALFKDINGTNPIPHNLAGLGGYALMLFENVPAGVKANVGGIGTPTTNAALQSPWYVGLSPNAPGIPKNGVDTGAKPGYEINTNKAIWQTFGDIWQEFD